jgi:hypothetical protein
MLEIIWVVSLELGFKAERVLLPEINQASLCPLDHSSSARCLFSFSALQILLIYNRSNKA